MKKLFVSALTAIATLFTMPAFATSFNTGDTTTATASASAVGHGGNAYATGGNAAAIVGVGVDVDVSNKASAQQAQNQGQQQGQVQGQSQNQANKQTNSQSMTYNESPNVHYSGKYTVKSAPAVFAPAAYATSPCRIALSGGVSVIGLGLSAGGSVEDEGCTLRENARILNSLGANDAALKLMCNDPKVAEVLASCK